MSFTRTIVRMATRRDDAGWGARCAIRESLAACSEEEVEEIVAETSRSYASEGNGLSVLHDLAAAELWRRREVERCSSKT